LRTISHEVLPGNFLDELAYELEASEQQARRQAERLAILSELQRVATAAAGGLGRPVTVSP
jgi:predicted ArsR family transcriptional regulator